MILLKVNRIDKTYWNGKLGTQVLKEVDFQMEKGEFVAIMGASGSGKSTLLNICAGIDSADKGNVVFQDQDLTLLNEDQISEIRRKDMGFIFQETRLMANLNMVDNIILPSLYDKGAKVNQLQRQAKELMERLGVSDLSNRMLAEISGGQKQRIGICRALLGNPALIFADEPTGALNSSAGMDVMTILEEAHHLGQSILMVTHDPKMATYADRTLLMVDGQIKEDIDFVKLGQFDKQGRLSFLTEQLNRLEI